MAAVNVVVTCTKRKTRVPDPEFRLGGVEADTPEIRAKLWLKSLKRKGGETVRALDLYSGDHWSVVRSIPDAVRSGTEVKLWVCSAGYGLVSAETRLHPYSATFSDRHSDQVHRFSGLSRREAHRRWWAALGRWQGPVPGEPRTVREMAERSAEIPIIVVGSDSYLDPLAPDLRKSLEVLASPDLLVILSGGTQRLAGLERNLIPFDARLNRVLRGPLMSLNARVARELLGSDVDLSAGAVAEWLTAFGRELPRFEYPVRKRVSDDDVKMFISRELASSPRVTWSSLHRKLRKKLLLACEQKRFRDLFFTVRAEVGAQQDLPL